MTHNQQKVECGVQCYKAPVDTETQNQQTVQYVVVTDSGRLYKTPVDEVTEN